MLGVATHPKRVLWRPPDLRPARYLAALVLAAHGPGARAAAAAAAAPSGFVVADGARFAVSTGAGTEPWVPVGYNQYRLTRPPAATSATAATASARTPSSPPGSTRSAPPAPTSSAPGSSRASSTPTAPAPGPALRSLRPRRRRGAAARGMRVIPVLVNHWADCEFGGAAKTVGFYESGFQSPGYGYSLSYATTRRNVAAHYATIPRSPSGSSPTRPRRPRPAAAARRPAPRTRCAASPPR